VDWLTERVDDAADKLLADRYRDDSAGPLHRVSLANLRVFAEQHRADAFFLEVERDAVDAVGELEHFARHGLLDAVHARDAVANRHDRADLGDVHVDSVAADLVANDFGDFFRFDVHMLSLGGCPGGQRFLYLLQLPGHAAVVHRAADARDG